MTRRLIAVVVVDVLLLIAIFLVAEDLQWRAAYAASPHQACSVLKGNTWVGIDCSYTPSFNFSILVQFFTMNGNGQQLVSPPTFSWIELFALVLVLLNVWFVWQGRKQRGRLQRD